MTSMKNQLLSISTEVSEALANGHPVVALESTIISHGLPRPRNLEVARGIESMVRAQNAIPATIAILDGRIRIGLNDDDLKYIAEKESIEKISRRDLPRILAGGEDGATTVSATMIAAHMAGIRIFATGGIGGVHRGATESFDISADLNELAVTPVAVVCAGAKAILDLPKTLEVLETLGVPVIGHGTDTLPAFWCRSSGLKLALRCDTPSEIARVLRMQHTLGFSSGTLVANPIPEAAALSNATVEQAIAEALESAEREAVVGAAVTPYLLSRLAEITAGASLEANVALVENNAKVAAQVAVAMSIGGNATRSANISTRL
ncbi:MAG: pseudouridine-5'-phosphate glycosidase [Alphaproteobacteria bacterium]|nr:pseudouridine-5'-phosphate glycosidase [Alphaproteobacteria bacterium]